MKSQSHFRKSLALRLALLGVAALGTLFASGCTYNEVMSERTAENNYLRGQLAEEEARGARLGQ